jgi:hypothetical protein
MILSDIFPVMVLAMAVLAGCSHRPADTVSAPPLPELATLPCCWQSEEQITLATAQGEIQLLAVVARQAEQLNLVVLDPLGRRVLALVYRAGEPELLTAPPRWDARLSHGIVVAIFLHHSQGGQWAAGKHWAVTVNTDSKTLYRDQEAVAQLTYLDASHNRRNVRFIGQKQTLDATTVRNTPLP